MFSLSKREQDILYILLQKESISSSEIWELVKKGGSHISLVTLKRALGKMVRGKFLLVGGIGPSTRYTVSTLGRIHADVNAKEYCGVEPDKRFGMRHFNFDLFVNFPTEVFTEEELSLLLDASRVYKKRILDVTPVSQKKELERLVIELSWKSSRIEGNTYTLLDTEKLILEHKEAVGHSKSEAQMILNHKDAFTFIHEHAKKFSTLTRLNLEEIHTHIINNLGVEKGLRKSLVGVLGSTYQPLDNVHQIWD